MAQTKNSMVLAALLAAAAFVLPAYAHGDKTIPQIADGPGGDGTAFRTKFDITNLGPYEETWIDRTVKLKFFRQGGQPWSISYKIGSTTASGSEVTLTLHAYQTVRLETLGASAQLTTGYAILQNSAPTSRFPEDYEIGLTVYYEVLKGGSVIDTISVPVGQPTYAFFLPVESDDTKNLYSGIAIVNLSNADNTISLELYRESPPRDGTGLALYEQAADITLHANEQGTGFLGGSLAGQAFFTGATKFKGMLFGWAFGPVSVMAILQTPSGAGVQYATLVPVYRDALRKNTFMYLQQGYPLDADLGISDYFLNDFDKDAWDLLYRTVSTTQRELVPQEGATFAVIGNKTPDEFNLLEISDLKGLTYSESVIDLRDNSANLQTGYTFAIRTGLGRYIKVRIAGTVEVPVTGGKEYDLQLQLFTYR